MKIFITGNVGSGKSTFLKLLQKYVNFEHYDFIDLDKIAKQVIIDLNIQLPEKTTNFFEHPELLFSLENEILPHLKDYFPNNKKIFIMEASTLIECPVLLDKEDMIIHIVSQNAVQNTLNRDKVENRAFLISRVQISPWIKSLICDVEVSNNSTLEDLENIAKSFAETLNYQATVSYQKEIQHVFTSWMDEFSTPNNLIINEIIKQYSLPNRPYTLTQLVEKLNHFSATNLELSPLWKKAVLLAIFYSNYFDNKEQNITQLWEHIKQHNLFDCLIFGSRSYVSLACELIFSIDLKELPNNLSFNEGLKSITYLKGC